MTRRIDISWKTIVFVTVFFLLLWIIFQILDIILLFFVAFIFMSAMAPLVDKLTRWRVPRVLAILLVLVTILGTLIGLLAIGLTPLLTQTSSLIKTLSDATNTMLQANNVDQSVIQKELTNFSGEVVGITVKVFENFISFVSVLVVTVYLLLDRERIEDYGTSFFVSQREKAKKVLRMTEDKLGAWLRGQLVLSLIIGVLIYFGLLILGVPYALPLAIIAGFLEVVPVLGPLISAIPAVLIALTISPLLAGLTTGLYFAIQQVEGHVIVPQVMKKAVGLNPILVILAVAVGGRLLGLGGALLAVPIAVVIQLMVQEILSTEKVST